MRAADVGGQQRFVGAPVRRWHRLSCHFLHLTPSAHWLALVSVTLNVQRTTWPARPVWPCDDNVVNTFCHVGFPRQFAGFAENATAGRQIRPCTMAVLDV